MTLIHYIAAQSTTSPPNHNGGLSTGAKASIGVGVAVGIIGLVLFGIALWRFRRTSKRTQTQITRDEKLRNWKGSQHLDGQPVSELPVEEKPVEKDASTGPKGLNSAADPVEMPAQGEHG